MDSANRRQNGSAWNQLNRQARDAGLPDMASSGPPPVARPRMSRLTSFEYDPNMQLFLSNTEEQSDDIKANYFSDCLRLEEAAGVRRAGIQQPVEGNYFSKRHDVKQLQKQKTTALMTGCKNNFENYWVHDNEHDENYAFNQGSAMNLIDEYPRHGLSTEGHFSSSIQTPEYPRDFNAEFCRVGSSTESSLLSSDFINTESTFSRYRSNVGSSLLPGNISPETYTLTNNTESPSHPSAFATQFNNAPQNSGFISQWLSESSNCIGGGGAIPRKKRAKARRHDSPVSSPFPAPLEELAFTGCPTHVDIGNEARAPSDIDGRSVVEVEGKLHGIVPVLIPLRQLSTEKKRQIANSCWMALSDNSRNGCEPEMQDVGLADVSSRGRTVCLALSSGSLLLIAPAESGGTGETLLATHNLRRLGLFYGYPERSNTLVYVGHSDLGGRKAVIITFCSNEQYSCVVDHLKMNTGSTRSKMT